MSEPPLTLSDMLRGMSEQMHALFASRTSIGPLDMFDLARTLKTCAQAARDLEDRAEPPAVHVPPILPESVIRFPLARVAR